METIIALRHSITVRQRHCEERSNPESELKIEN